METKMITIPFEVELAKKIQAGEHPGKIITRDGRDVRVVCFDAKRGHPVLSLVTENEMEEFLQSNMSDGSFYGDGDENVHDLVLQVPEWTQYKEGDVVACEVDNGGGDYCKWLSILQGKVDLIVSNIGYSSYATYDYDSDYNVGRLTYDDYPDNIDSIRLATEDEKRMLIKRLKEEDTEQAKDILKRFFGIKKKPEYKFEFLQPVLVKGNSSKTSWRFGQFTHIVQGKAGTWYHVSGGNCFLNCIPYNEQTKHLLGTKDNWEGEQ